MSKEQERNPGGRQNTGRYTTLREVFQCVVKEDYNLIMGPSGGVLHQADLFVNVPLAATHLQVCREALKGNRVVRCASRRRARRFDGMNTPRRSARKSMQSVASGEYSTESVAEQIRIPAPISVLPPISPAEMGDLSATGRIYYDNEDEGRGLEDSGEKRSMEMSYPHGWCRPTPWESHASESLREEVITTFFSQLHCPCFEDFSKSKAKLSEAHLSSFGDAPTLKFSHMEWKQTAKLRLQHLEQHHGMSLSLAAECQEDCMPAFGFAPEEIADVFHHNAQEMAEAIQERVSEIVYHEDNPFKTCPIPQRFRRPDDVECECMLDQEVSDIESSKDVSSDYSVVYADEDPEDDVSLDAKNPLVTFFTYCCGVYSFLSSSSLSLASTNQWDAVYCMCSTTLVALASFFDAMMK